MSKPQPPSAKTARTRKARTGERMAPLYRQVYAILRDQIVGGQVPANAPLPSEPALAQRFAVSRITIRKTLEHLERENLVRRVRGVGTFPIAPDPGLRPANISGYLENLISFEASTTAITLSWETVSPRGPARAALGPEPCLRIARLRSYRDQPISFTTIHVPARHAAGLDRDACGDRPIIHAIEATGVTAERTEQTITAVPADGAVADRLGVAAHSPLICMRRTMLDGDNAPVLHQESLYAPDRFEYRMTLTRTSVGSAARWTPIA